MAQRLVFFRIDVELGAEGMRVLIFLGTGIDQRTGDAVERPTFQRAFDDIAAQERPQILEQPAKTGGERVIAAQRMVGLHHVPQRDQQQRGGDHETPEKPLVHPKTENHESDGERQRHPEAQISLESTVSKQPANHHAKRPFP